MLLFMLIIGLYLFFAKPQQLLYIVEYLFLSIIGEAGFELVFGEYASEC